MSARPRLPAPLALALALAVAVAAAGLAACGAGRNVLGTNTSPCFLALPTAKQAVEGRGSLAGVRLVDVPRLTAPADRAIRGLLAQLPLPRPRELCVVAYTGSFTPDQVELPAGLPPSGGTARYAIAVVTFPKPRLLGTFVVPHEPLSFRRTHVGL
jgi:hypothetical protein